MGSRGQAVTIRIQIPSPLVIVVPGFFDAVATDITNWMRISGGFPLKGAAVDITAKGAPGTSPVTFDLMQSVDGGVSFATVLPSGSANKLTLPVGDKLASFTPTWTTDLSDGDILRVDLVQIDDGSGHDLVIVITPT